MYSIFYCLYMGMKKLLFLCGFCWLLYSGMVFAQITNPEDISDSFNQVATAFDNSWCKNPVPWAQYHPWQQRCYCTQLGKKFIKISPMFGAPFPSWVCQDDSSCTSGRLWNDETSTCIDQNNDTQSNNSSSSERWEFGSSPLEILDNVTNKANPANDRIQDTALDSVTHSEWSYPFTYRLANTFDSIRKRVAPYLDWMLYIGLSVAVILLIWQGMQLVVGKTFADIRKPTTNIVIGVVVLTWVYLIIRLMTSVMALIFNI